MNCKILLLVSILQFNLLILFIIIRISISIFTYANLKELLKACLLNMHCFWLKMAAASPLPPTVHRLSQTVSVLFYNQKIAEYTLL